MQQEFQDKRCSAQKQVTGNYSLVFFVFFFLTHPSLMKKLYIEQVQNILMRSIYQFFFWTFWNIEEQFLDNRMSKL